MPINIKLGSETLKYATVQPVTQFYQGREISLFYTAIDGIPVEFMFQRNAELKTTGKIELLDGMKCITQIEPSQSSVIQFDSNGISYKICVLSFINVLKLYKSGSQIMIANACILENSDASLYLFGIQLEEGFIIKSYPLQNFQELEGDFSVKHVHCEHIPIDVTLAPKRCEINSCNKKSILSMFLLWKQMMQLCDVKLDETHLVLFLQNLLSFGSCSIDACSITSR